MLIYLLGVIAAIWCVLDIIKKKCDGLMKILLIVGVLATSWLGVIVYYFLLRTNIK